jgi:hypothetical protein
MCNRRSCVKDRSVGGGIEGKSIPPLFPIQHTIVFIIPRPCLPVSCLLHPMLGQQEAHPQFRYIKAVGNLDPVHLSVVVFDCKPENVPSSPVSNPLPIPSTCPLSLVRLKSLKRWGLLAMHQDAWLLIPMGIESESNRTCGGCPGSITEPWRARSCGLLL